MTQNNEPKQQRKIPSQMEYREKAHWKVGEDIITAVGGDEQKPIAFIKLERYDENKKPIFSCRDLDGNPLSDETSNLYELKKNLKDKEIELTQAMQNKEQTQEKETHVHVEVPAPQQANVSKVPGEEKGAELKNVRRSKTNITKETDQTISH